MDGIEEGGGAGRLRCHRRSCDCECLSERARGQRGEGGETDLVGGDRGGMAR